MAMIRKRSRPMAGQTPIVTAARRIWQPDVNIRGLQVARESGIALHKQDVGAEQRAEGIDVSNPMLQLVEAIKKNSDIDVALKVLKLGFSGRVINLTAGVPALIITRAKWPRGYIIINPAELTGFTSTVTFFPLAARAIGVYTSPAFNVSGVDTARIFLDITASAGTLTVDAQTQDPLSGNWAVSQADIFAGASAIGTYYASIGPLGVDRNIRMVATVAVGAITFSVSGLLKGGSITPTGSTVYIGDVNVTTVAGYPILPGHREYFWLGDDVELYAISPTEPMTLKVFQLQ